jgi:hypothetical protein
MTRIIPWSRLAIVVLVSCVLLTLTVSTREAAASDQDGVAGYSMKLKNKEFDGSNTGTGGGSLTTPQSASIKLAQSSSSMVHRSDVSADEVVVVPSNLRWLIFWVGRH